MIFSTFFIMNAVNHGGKRGSEVGGNSKLMRIPFISCHLLRRFVIICCCCKESFKSLSDAQLVCCTKTLVEIRLCAAQIIPADVRYM